MTTTTSVEIVQLAGSVGAQVVGVDLAQPLDDRTFDEIRAAFLQHLVLVFRNQDITPENHLDFARRWGVVLVHPYVPSIDGHPGVMKVYDPTPITQQWHADITYAVRPPKLSILVARTLPPVGGDTMFANQYLAYETLSPKLQELLRSLRAEHQGTALAKQQGLTDDEIKATHPVVRTHPETGRRSLFINADYTKRFEGMTDDESRPLLEFLYRHASRPEFTFRHRWAPGDILMWDNRAVQHAVIGDVGGAERALHRVTIEGDEPR